MNDTNQVVERITHVELTDFRGWRKAEAGGTFKVDLWNADFVLLVSPNGHGKSSLLEAISRVLNDQGFHKDEDNAALETPPTKKVDEKKEPPKRRPTWSIELFCQRTGEPTNRSVKWVENIFTKPQVLGKIAPEHLLRATVYQQDRVLGQFEYFDSEQTLIGFIAPQPPFLKNFRNAIDNIIEEWNKIESPEQLDEKDVISAKESLNEIVYQLLHNWINWRPDDIGTYGRETVEDRPLEILCTLAEKVLNHRLPCDYIDNWNWLDNLTEWVEETAPRIKDVKQVEEAAKARRDLDLAKEQLAKHESKWPQLDEIAIWIGEYEPLEAILDLVKKLAGVSPVWSDPRDLTKLIANLPEESRKQVPATHEILKELSKELSHIDTARAHLYAGVADIWLNFWKDIFEERKNLIISVEDAEKIWSRIEKYEARDKILNLLKKVEATHDAFLRALLKEENYRRKIHEWEVHQSALKALKEQQNLWKTEMNKRLPESARTKVEDGMNAIFKHFRVADAGDDPIIVNFYEEKDQPRAFKFDFRDGRELERDLSTGQQAQTALGWLLVANRMLTEWLPHRVLLLDDVSTALDLTNLAAECTLLRKLSYRKDESQSKKPFRRQVILASHHDQLTHRIFDLMLPPGDHTMCEIRITDWNWKEGPRPEVYDIKQTKKADDETREELAKKLRRFIGVDEYSEPSANQPALTEA